MEAFSEFILATRRSRAALLCSHFPCHTSRPSHLADSGKCPLLGSTTVAPQCPRPQPLPCTGSRAKGGDQAPSLLMAPLLPHPTPAGQNWLGRRVHTPWSKLVQPHILPDWRPACTQVPAHTRQRSAVGNRSGLYQQPEVTSSQKFP